jgi:hypothetical protein
MADKAMTRTQPDKKTVPNTTRRTVWKNCCGDLLPKTGLTGWITLLHATFG